MRLLVPFLCLLLSSCVDLAPFRTELPTKGSACTNCPETSLNSEHSIRESTEQYDLYFVEFDDQGLQYPAEMFCTKDENDPCKPPKCDLTRNDCLNTPAAAYQINNLIKQLNQTLSGEQWKGMSLVVYIHGWKHNAESSDPNLKGFRQLLENSALIEKELKTGRRVAGLYVSWRGQSIDLPYLEDITFWSRKTAALHVAQGSSRELFARLRGFKCAQNSKGQKEGERNCNRPATGDQPVKVVLIGHSFGALVLYNSISGSLIESMTHAFDAEADEKAYWRFGDLTVLLNPAFEATRYTPLHRIARGADYSRYEAPLLVSITSSADQATGIAFPAGRAINSIFERYAPLSEERVANRRTMGHYAPYITHELKSYDDEKRPAECAGWQVGTSLKEGTTDQRKLAANLEIEERNRERFFCDNGEWSEAQFKLKRAGWLRQFCGGVQLEHTGGKENSPIWNVSTDASIIKNHNDIMEPKLVDFFRQLYLDTVLVSKSDCRRALN